MKLPKLLNVLLLAATITLLVGCEGCSSPRALDPTGPYGRIDAARPVVESGLTLGQQLVQIDQNIIGAKSLLDGFMLWEHSNRAFIPSDAVKQFAKRLEVEGPRALQSATRLRDAYALDPSSGNRTALEASLAVVDALLLEVGLYRPAAATLK